MVRINARIPEKTKTWLLQNFKTKGAGAEYVLAAVPELYRRTLRDLKGRFTTGELSLMIDCVNATILTPQLAGQHLVINCVDSMELDGTASKWSVDRDGFTDSLQALSIFEAACLGIWARGFWESGTWEKEGGGLEEWVGKLA